MAESLTIYTVDQTGHKWPLHDAKGLSFKNTENGYATASWGMARRFSAVYDDIGLAMPIVIYSSRGDIAWQGIFEGYEPKTNRGRGSVNCTAVGLWATAYWQEFNGIIASAAPETQIAGLVSGGYLPHLSSVTALVATGVASNPYQTGNGGTDDVEIADVILALCKRGTSTQQRVIPAVWNDRILSTTALALTPTPDYIVSARLIDDNSLRRNLSTIGTRVMVRYRDSTTHAIARATVNDTTMQANLAAYYPTGTVNFVKTETLDISGINETTSAVATDTANTRLNNAKKVKSDSPIVISTEYAIFDVNGGQEVPLWSIRAGKFLRIPDLLPRSSEAGSGTLGGDVGITTLFYISQVQYNVDNHTLTITPEASSDLSTIVA